MSEVAHNHEYFMAQALREAERGLNTARPNPRVGCVLVKDGKVISRGFHKQTGTAHAEANAIKNTSEDLRGATAYVTLEPCSFFGRTPSCAHALIDHGIRRVVYAATDPHPGNRGVGLDKLRAAGIEVIGPVMEAQGVALNPGHFKKYSEGLPFVRLKLAQSLDGKTALSNGASQWITSPAARKDVQRLRARSCAVVTGVETVLADDPSMSVRAAELDDEFAELAAEIRRPIVVLDSKGRFPDTAQLANNSNLVLVSAGDIASERHVSLPASNAGQIDLPQLLQYLAEKEDCSEVLFECGPTLAGSLIAEDLVDELVIYTAPKLMGSGARELLSFGPLASMSEVKDFAFTDVRKIGPDIRLTLTSRK